jgi:hypothetical protein
VWNLEICTSCFAFFVGWKISAKLREQLLTNHVAIVHQFLESLQQCGVEERYPLSFFLSFLPTIKAGSSRSYIQSTARPFAAPPLTSKCSHWSVSLQLAIESVDCRRLVIARSDSTNNLWLRNFKTTLSSGSCCLTAAVISVQIWRKNGYFLGNGLE